MSSVAILLGSLRVNIKSAKMEIVEFANNVNPVEAAHNEQPLLDFQFALYTF